MDVDTKLANDEGMKLTFLLIASLMLAGCAKESPSEIVRKVETAGAGDLRSVPQKGIEDWFRRHSELAAEVVKECRPIREAAPAIWSTTTEGRVCDAAKVASAFHVQERKGDGRGFEAGK